MRETPRLPPAARLIARDAVSSTSDVAREAAEQGAPDATVVWATRQTAGRGRLGRSWSSPPGNLYTSLVLRPACPPAVAPQLSFVAAVALAEALTPLLPGMAQLRLKWPNDVLLNGRKLVGILAEAESGTGDRLDFVVLGIGVNLVSHPPDARYGATDLGAEGAVVTPAAMLELLVPALLAWRDRWVAEGFAPIRAAWLARAEGRGQPIEVRLGNALIRGTFDDLDGDGALIVETAPGSRRRITAGDIVALAPQA